MTLLAPLPVLVVLVLKRSLTKQIWLRVAHSQPGYRIRSPGYPRVMQVLSIYLMHLHWMTRSLPFHQSKRFQDTGPVHQRIHRSRV